VVTLPISSSPSLVACRQRVVRQALLSTSGFKILSADRPAQTAGSPAWPRRAEDADVDLDEVERFCTKHDFWSQLANSSRSDLTL
jgi:hypothetical protein